MTTLHTTISAAMAFAALSACAQLPEDHATTGAASVPAVSDKRMAMMDQMPSASVKQ